MKANLYIGKTEIGNIELEIIDEFMGVLSGKLNPNKNYDKFKQIIMNHFDEKGISNINDFNYKIILENGCELNPEGGIGVIHSQEFIDEILVETAGNNLEKIKNYG